VSLPRVVIALLVVSAFAWVSHAWAEAVFAGDPGRLDTANTGAALGLLLFGSFLAGQVATRLSLPAIVGYLLFGVLCGSSVLHLVNPAELTRLGLVKDFAVALIGLTAGGEIHLDFLRRSFRQVTVVTLGVVVATITGIGLIAYPVTRELGWIGEGGGSVWPAIVIATVMAANSPAVLIALVTSMGARGTMPQLALAVTVFKDMVLLAIFALVVALATSQLGSGEGASASGVALRVGKEIGGSVLMGLVFGGLMAWYVRRIRVHVAVFVVFACLAIALVSEALHLESLLVAVVAGLLLANVFPDLRGQVFDTTEELSTPVYCVFFAFAGAGIDLAALREMWAWAMLIVAARAALLLGGTTLGARVAGVEGAPGRWLWTSMIPQAGVALALTVIATDALLEAGFAPAEGMETLLLACVAMNQLAGPLALKLGLTRAGDS
jgi:Kef-type K+ transport system membrane component KefB